MDQRDEKKNTHSHTHKIIHPSYLLGCWLILLNEWSSRNLFLFLHCTVLIFFFLTICLFCIWCGKPVFKLPMWLFVVCKCWVRLFIVLYTFGPIVWKKNKIAIIRLRSIGGSVRNELITKIWNVFATYFLLQFQSIPIIAPPFSTAFATINCWCD